MALRFNVDMHYQDTAEFNVNLKENEPMLIQAFNEGVQVSLNTDYEQLQNLPKINGVTLLGDLSSGELSLLSAKSSDYLEISEQQVQDKFILVLGDNQNAPTKLSIAKIPSALGLSKVETVEQLNPNVENGTYQFVKK